MVNVPLTRGIPRRPGRDLETASLPSCTRTALESKMPFYFFITIQGAQTKRPQAVSRMMRSEPHLECRAA